MKAEVMQRVVEWLDGGMRGHLPDTDLPEPVQETLARFRRRHAVGATHLSVASQAWLRVQDAVEGWDDHKAITELEHEAQALTALGHRTIAEAWRDLGDEL